MLVQMFIVLMFQTCAQYSLELWKLARYNGITMLPFGLTLPFTVHHSTLCATTFSEIGVYIYIYIIISVTDMCVNAKKRRLSEPRTPVMEGEEWGTV